MPQYGRTSFFFSAVFCALSACEGTPADFWGKVNKPTVGKPAGSIEIVEKDVLQPRVYQNENLGFWDGKNTPGLWVAVLDAPRAERVLVRNRRNRKSIEATLYKQPTGNIVGDSNVQILISSEVAKALSIKAKKAVPLSVTALRREAIAVSTKSGGSPKNCQPGLFKSPPIPANMPQSVPILTSFQESP